MCSTTFTIVLNAAFLIATISSSIQAEDPLRPIDIREIDVAGEIGRRIDVTISNNLMVLDADKEFLQPFKDKQKRSGYIGLGKLIDALVRFAAYTDDEKVLDRKQHVVRETIATQEPDGYIGTFVPEARLWTLWDLHEASYIVLGLTSDYTHFNEQPSLNAARKLADHIIQSWSADPKLDPSDGRITVLMAQTGLEPAMLALHEATGDKRYLAFCVTFRQLPQWNDPIVLGRWGSIEGHAYAYLARCVAQLRLHDVAPDKRLFDQTHGVLDFLTMRDGMVITGACCDHECWHDTQSGTVNLAETCSSAYLIRVLDELIRKEDKAEYGDVMERILYNTLFGAQSPDGRRLRYYTPFDGPRGYWHTDSYCCPNNYRRIIAELPCMVFYCSADGVTVNLYTGSSAQMKLESGLPLSLAMRTDYPNTGRVVLHVNPSKPASFPIRFRIPRWCSRPDMRVNGEPSDIKLVPGTFGRIEREWKAGDRIELNMPMACRLVEGWKAQAGRVAAMRGPMVFCLNRKRHEKLANVDLRAITIDPTSLEGPVVDESVRPKGLACRIKAWRPGAWYPYAKPDWQLTLTEFADPDGEAVYFHIPNPNADLFVEDELIQRKDAKP